MITYRNPYLHAAAVDIAALPADPEETTRLFDAVAVELGVELWPLPEFSHDQFLRDRDHDGWLQQMNHLVVVLQHLNLDQPFDLRTNDGGRHVGHCLLCKHKTKATARAGDAGRVARFHAANAHGWTPGS